MLRSRFSVARFLMGMTFVFTSALMCWADDQKLQSKLPGEWQVDVEKTKAALKKADYGEDEIKAFTSRAGMIRLTFLKEMRLVVRLSGEDKRELAGKTKIQETDAEKKLIKLLVTPEQKDSPPETVFTITFLEDDVIVVVAGQEPPLTLMRVKPDKDADGEKNEAK